MLPKNVTAFPVQEIPDAWMHIGELARHLNIPETRVSRWVRENQVRWFYPVAEEHMGYRYKICSLRDAHAMLESES